jgi:DNA-directed RNA polymerase subunit RPC12/RpoP
MDDFGQEFGEHLESEKIYSKCLRCGKELVRYKIYADKSLLRCAECNKERSLWGTILYAWFLLGIPIIYIVFYVLLPRGVNDYIVEYPILGYLLIGGLWCGGLVAIEVKKGK